MSPPTQKVRRWQRQQVDLPVNVAVYYDAQRTLIPGRAADICEGGMSLYAGMHLQPGDLVEVEFGAPFFLTLQATIRYRTGFTFGLEFITPLPL